MFKFFILCLVSIGLYADAIWYSNVELGLKTARSYRVPIVVFVYKDGCKYCRKSIEGFRYPPLKETLTNHSIFPLAIKASDVQTLNRLELYTETYPSYFILSEYGKLVTQPVKGFVEPDELNDYLKRMIIQYKEIKF